MFPLDGMEPATLQANADAALYRAKRQGRGEIQFFEPEMDYQIRESRALQQQIGQAITNNELRVFYQPQARIGGPVLGFEALLRWHHPQRGLITPDIFVPLAEDSGAIIEIGSWVLQVACREAAGWPDNLKVAVNLSPVQFRHGDLVAEVLQVLLDTGLAAERLELEITESVLIDDFDRALSVLRRLKAMDIRIALDDFGTGYSSLSYLHAFPFDRIKLDRTFIRGVSDKPQSLAIVRAVIGMASGLSLAVTAEGVETQEQLQVLAREGCEEYQAYLLGTPQTIAHYANVIEHPERSPRTVATPVGRTCRGGR